MKFQKIVRKVNNRNIFLITGGNRCVCPVKIVAAAFTYRQAEKDRICFDFCRFHHVTLRGCSRCPFETKETRRPLKNNVAALPPPPPPQQPMFAPIHFESSPVRQNNNFLQFDSPADAPGQAPSTAAPTTPDWNLLCIQLCRRGTGGILCNCDLAPF